MLIIKLLAIVAAYVILEDVVQQFLNWRERNHAND